MTRRCEDCDGPMTFADEYDFVGWYCAACAERAELEELERQEAEEEGD